MADALATRQPHANGNPHEQRVDRQEGRDRSAQDGQQRVQEERHDRRRNADTEQGNEQGKERDRRNRLEQARNIEQDARSLP